MDLAATLQAARALSVDERIELVQIIWDEIAEDGALPDLTDAQKAELDRRIAAADANPDDVIPWEEARTRILDKLRR